MPISLHIVIDFSSQYLPSLERDHYVLAPLKVYNAILNRVCMCAHFLHCSDLNKHKRYEIRLSVYNAVGEGPTSSPQEVFVGEAGKNTNTPPWCS